MKFDLSQWGETKHEIQIGQGRVRLQVSAPAPLYAQAHGTEVLVGYGSSFDLEFAEAVILRVDAPKEVRVFIERQRATVWKDESEEFTNIDRMPLESGALYEVRKAAREFEMQRRAMLREIRAERDRLKSEVIDPENPAKAKAEPGAADEGAAE